MTFPANIARYHIDTAPLPNGCYLARFHHFDSPAPHAIVQSMARAGYIVRGIQIDGQQTELCIKYQEAA